MLDLLIGYAERNGIVLEPGVERKTVKWLITCTEDGYYTGVIPLGEKKGQQFICPVTPGMVAGGRSHFLAETLETMVCFTNTPEQQKGATKHDYFVNLCTQASHMLPILNGAITLLRDDAQRQQIWADLSAIRAKPIDIATLRIAQVTPLEGNEWREWWKAYRPTLLNEKPIKKTATQSICLVTGQLVEPVLTNPKIKGLAGVGGMPAGDVVVGFDKDAFCSFGFKQSQNAAMSNSTAAAYAAALNHVIAEKSAKLGNTLAAYWYTESVAVEDDLLAWLREPAEQTAGAAELKAHGLLTAIREGKRADLVNNRYVALLMSGQAGRVMMREVMQGAFEALAANVESWFRDLAIVERDGTGLAPSPKFLAVAGSLVRDLKDLPSPWLQQLWRSAVAGGVIPATALAQATLRARIDVINNKPASHARMGLIKAYLIRQGDTAMQLYLNIEHPHPAYHCGRLMAVLAGLQRYALGDVGAGVVQRYYAAASQSPGLIFGRLVRNAQHHLGKPEVKGKTKWIEKWLEEISGHLKDSYPRNLTLEEQSLFALGYYQQLAALNAGKGKSDNGQDTTDDQA